MVGWIRGRISLSIARAASACLRGFGRTETRESILERETEIGFLDGAALDRMFRQTSDTKDIRRRKGGAQWRPH